jgi:hypothetical protein
MRGKGANFYQFTDMKTRNTTFGRVSRGLRPETQESIFAQFRGKLLGTGNLKELWDFPKAIYCTRHSTEFAYVEGCRIDLFPPIYLYRGRKYLILDTGHYLTLK